MSTLAIVNALKVLVDAVTGIRPASNLSEMQSTAPACVVYPARNAWTQDTLAHPLDAQAVTLIAEVGVQRSDLQRDVERLMPFDDLVRNAVAADQTIGGTVLGVTSLVAEFGGPPLLQFFDIGWRFTVEMFLYDDV